MSVSSAGGLQVEVSAPRRSWIRDLTNRCWSIVHWSETDQKGSIASLLAAVALITVVGQILQCAPRYIVLF